MHDTYLLTNLLVQESRAVTGRTACCHCKFRYISNFTRHRAVSLSQHGFLVYMISDRWNAEISQSTLIFTVVMQNHGDKVTARDKNHSKSRNQLILNYTVVLLTQTW